jgi:hypothetical protein
VSPHPGKWELEGIMAIKLFNIPNEAKALTPSGAEYICQHLYEKAVLGQNLNDEEFEEDVFDIATYGDKASALCGDCIMEFDQVILETAKEPVYETGRWEPSVDQSVFKGVLDK